MERLRGREWRLINERVVVGGRVGVVESGHFAFCGMRSWFLDDRKEGVQRLLIDWGPYRAPVVLYDAYWHVFFLMEGDIRVGVEVKCEMI
jgi:hypothetical protein